MTDVVVRDLQESEWSQWDTWLATQPWAPPFASAWWLEATCRAFGGRPLLLAAFEDDQVVGGVALRITDIGPAHIVRPSILYNPVVVDGRSPVQRLEILQALLEAMEARRLIVRAISSTPDMVDLRAAVWRHWVLTVSWTAVIPLRGWTSDRDVSGGEVKQIKRARRAGISVSVESPDASLLYGLMSATLRRHDVADELSARRLRALVEGAGSHGIQTVVRDADGTPLSASFVMAHGPRAAYGVWGGTSPAGLAKGASVARDVFRLKDLADRGFEYFDWCGASLPGISDYKLKFGGALRTHFAIAREPLWFRTVSPVYTALKRVVRRA